MRPLILSALLLCGCTFIGRTLDCMTWGCPEEAYGEDQCAQGCEGRELPDYNGEGAD